MATIFGKIIKKATDTVTDYGKGIAKSAVIPSEIITGRAIYTPKFRTGIAKKTAATQGKISSITVPIAMMIAPKPVSSVISTTGSVGGALIPNKKPVLIPVDTVPIVPKTIPVEPRQLSPYEQSQQKGGGVIDQDKDRIQREQENQLVLKTIPVIPEENIPIAGLPKVLQLDNFKRPSEVNLKPVLYTALGLGALYGIYKFSR